MKSFPMLDKIHQYLSQSLVNWCERHNFVRFDNLRAQNSTDEDVKSCSAFWFCLTTLFGAEALYFVFRLSVSGILFFLMLFYVTYAIGVINMEALKIKTKLAEQRKDEDNKSQTIQENAKRPVWIRLLSLTQYIIFIWLFSMTFWQPEKIQQWAVDYNLYEYVKSSGINETNTAGIFALCVFLAYVLFVRIVMVLFYVLYKAKQHSVKNYSLERSQKFHSQRTKD